MNEDMPQILPWQGVDGFLVINMDSSPERYSRFLETTGHYFPADKTERVSAVAGRELPTYGHEPWFTERTGERARFWGGTAGCALSHRKAIMLAKSRGWRNVLIFEDDCVLEHAEIAGSVVAEALRCTKGRYLLYLGYNGPAPFGTKRATLDHGVELWKTEGVLATHAYLVPESMYEPLLALLPESDSDVWRWLSRYRAVDVFYRDFVPMLTGARIYVLHPILAGQAGGVSDITDTLSDTDERIARDAPRPCYGVKRIMRALTRPLRRLSIRLNSIRTHRRAIKGGFPGFSKRQK